MYRHKLQISGEAGSNPALAVVLSQTVCHMYVFVTLANLTSFAHQQLFYLYYMKRKANMHELKFLVRYQTVVYVLSRPPPRKIWQCRQTGAIVTMRPLGSIGSNSANDRAKFRR